MSGHVVVVRLELTEVEWQAMKKVAKYRGEAVRQTVAIEAACGIRAEVDAVLSGARDPAEGA